MAHMTPWSPSADARHDDAGNLCYFASRDNQICWEVATDLWHKSLGVAPVCEEHYEELARRRRENPPPAMTPLSDRWGD